MNNAQSSTFVSGDTGNVDIHQTRPRAPAIVTQKTSQFYPDPPPANQFLRYEETSPPYLFDEQLYLASPDNCFTLQTSLTDRIVLQMDHKRHLRIKAFYGAYGNAVKTQIWIAISFYLLGAIIKKKLRIKRTLNKILPALCTTLFEIVNYYKYLQI